MTGAAAILALIVLVASACPRPGHAAVLPVTLPGPDGIALDARLELPAVVTRPAVIALHGCAGLRRSGEELLLGARDRDWAARLVARGHPVLFLDSFGPRGLGSVCGRTDHAAPPAVRARDAGAAVAWLRTQPWNPGAPVLLGWSHGGSTVLLAWRLAPPGSIGAAIAFYPGCGPRSIGAGWQPDGDAPLLMLLGGADDWTPHQPCLGLASLAPARITAVAYEGAHHGFDTPSDTLHRIRLPGGRLVTSGGNAAAAAAAIDAVAGLLDRHAAPRRGPGATHLAPTRPAD